MNITNKGILELIWAFICAPFLWACENKQRLLRVIAAIGLIAVVVLYALGNIGAAFVLVYCTAVYILFFLR